MRESIFTTYRDTSTARLPERIGILGGTFNPPHRGHLDVAERLAQEFALDSVLIMPVGDPPHKRDVFVADKRHRARMVELLCEDGRALTPCMIEMEREGYTYTVDSMRILTRALPDAEFYYIIGTDTLYQLTSWRRFEEVFAMTRFICMYRPGDELGSVCEYIHELSRRYGVSILLSRHSGLDVSSTEVRRLAAAGEDISPYVTEKVSAYIEQNKVYSSLEDRI